MLAVVYEGPKRTHAKRLTEPKALRNQTLVRMKNASICGTDLHFYKGEWRAKKGIILGHDASGLTETTGERVALEFVAWCGSCAFCRQGRENLCERAGFMGFDRNGFFAEKVSIPSQNLYPLQDEVDFEEAACLEPLALAVHTFNNIKANANDSVTILGQGAVGLCMTQIAKLRRCKVIAVDLYQYRLDLARKFGADYVINAAKEDVEKTVRNITRGGSQFVIEAAGSKVTVEQTSKLVRPDGRVALVGASRGNMEFKDEALFSGVTAYTISEKKLALKLVAAGSVDLKSLISHRFSLEDFNRAVGVSLDPSKRPVKVLLYS